MEKVMTSTPKKASHRPQQTDVNKNVFLSKNASKVDHTFETLHYPNFLSCDEFISSLKKTQKNVDFSKPFSRSHDTDICVSKTKDKSLCSSSFENSCIKSLFLRDEDADYLFKPIRSPRHSQHEESKLFEPSTVLPGSKPCCSSQLSFSSAKSSSHRLSDPCISSVSTTPQSLDRRKSGSSMNNQDQSIRQSFVPVHQKAENKVQANSSNSSLIPAVRANRNTLKKTTSSSQTMQHLEEKMLNYDRQKSNNNYDKAESFLQSIPTKEKQTSFDVSEAGRNYEDAAQRYRVSKVENVFGKGIDLHSSKRKAVTFGEDLSGFHSSLQSVSEPAKLSSAKKFDRMFGNETNLSTPCIANTLLRRDTQFSFPYKSERTLKIKEELYPNLNVSKGDRVSLNQHGKQRKEKRVQNEFGESDFKLNKSFPADLSVRRDELESSYALEHSLRLISLLYRTDDQTRNDIVMMARCFKRWQMNIRRVKAQRQLLAYHANLAYGFYRSSILTHCFSHWIKVYKKRCDFSQAFALHRRHLLKKALKALTWAVHKGREEVESVSFRRDRFLVHNAFIKWKVRCEGLQDLRRQMEVEAWKRDSHLLEKCKQFQSAVNYCAVRRTFKLWRTVMDTQRKTKLARKHFRYRCLRVTFHNWCVFVAESKVKALQDSLAQVTLDRLLKTRWFYKWCAVFYQRKQARYYNRRRRLKRYWNHWKTLLPLHRANVQRLTSVAVQHRRHSLLYKYLQIWNNALLEKKTKSVYYLKIIQKCWLRWRRKFIEKVTESSKSKRSLKRNVFLQLRSHAELSKKRREAAFKLIQTSLIRRAFLGWKTVYVRKKNERQGIRTCEKREKYVCLSLSFDIWIRALAVRNWERFALTVYWTSCKRWAFKTWRENLNEKHLIPIEKEVSERTDHLQLKGAFKTWLQRHVQKQKEVLFAKLHNLDPKLECKRHFFTQWRVVTQQSLTIQPLQDRVKWRQLLSVFDGWRSVVLRKQLITAYCEYHTRQKLVKTFLWWRVKYLSSVQNKECAKISAMSTQKLFFRRWSRSYQMMKKKTNFQNQSLVWKYFQSWKIRLEFRKQRVAANKEIQRSTLLSKYFKRLKTYTLRMRMKREVSSQADSLRRYHLLKSALTRFKYTMLERCLDHVPCDMNELSYSGEFPVLCRGDDLRDSINKRRLGNAWRTWVIQYIQNKATKHFRANKLCHRYFQLWYSNTCERNKEDLKMADSVYNHQQLRQVFVKWQHSTRCRQEQRIKLHQCLENQNMRIAMGALSKWRKQYQLHQAKKLENLFIKRKIFVAWKIWTIECTDRKLRCRAFQRAVEERTMNVSFNCWKHVHVAVKLGVSYEEGLVMSAAYGSWLKLSNHLDMIDRLCCVFLVTHEQSVLWRSFMLWKDCLHWNKILEETGDVFKHQRNSRLKKVYLTKWKKRYLKRSAWNHYSSGLVKKSFGVWKAWMGTPI